MSDFISLNKKLNLNFKNIDLLKTALTHRSYLNEHRGENLEHNERLEFLGDAVLELVVTEYLFNTYDKPEGELTNLRSALVKGETLNEIGRKLEIEDYLLLSRGEARSKEHNRSFIVANAVEALIGALYLDKGYREAQKFIIAHVIKELPQILEMRLYRDPKSLFQEKAQEKTGITPSYKLLDETGPDHDKHFTIGVYLNRDLVAKGAGRSKQEGEQQAAERALEEKGWD